MKELHSWTTEAKGEWRQSPVYWPIQLIRKSIRRWPLLIGKIPINKYQLFLFELLFKDIYNKSTKKEKNSMKQSLK